MKKFSIVFVALAASAVMAFAGEKSPKCSGEKLGPEARKFGVEVQFNPFSNNFQTFKLNGLNLQGRYFFSEKNAIRFNVGVGLDADKHGVLVEVVPMKDNFDNVKEYDRAMEVYKLDMKSYEKATKSDLSVGAGYERHFPVGRRVDLYAGAQLGLSCHFASYHAVDYNYEGEWDLSKPMETWVERTSVLGVSSASLQNPQPESTIGVTAGAFAGVDVYVFKGLYVGAELGLYASESAYLGAKAVWKTDKVGADPKKQVHEFATNGSNFNLGFRCLPALRLGWTF